MTTLGLYLERMYHFLIFVVVVVCERGIRIGMNINIVLIIIR